MSCFTDTDLDWLLPDDDQDARALLTRYSDDQPRDDHGRFGSGGISLTPTSERVFEGQPVETETRLSRQEAGALGEKIAIAHLKAEGIADASPLNVEHSNYPVDAAGDHMLVEIKTGQVSNGADAQKWRATIGQPGKAESAWLKTASPEDKAAHNLTKADAIMARKQAVLTQFSERLGTTVQARTITTIINPDTRTADVYSFSGFHRSIGWNSALAKASYVKSYHYD